MTLTQEQIDRVKSLEDAEGRITPDAVVEDARKKDSPLHDLFEWDKAKAAMITWIAQAREVIGAVRVIHTTQTRTIATVCYVHDPDAKNTQGYRSVAALRSEPDRARQTLVSTLEVAAGHVRRAFDLAEPLGLSGEIDGLLDEIVGVQRRIQSAA